jgi:TatD DNase family protein
VIDSHCHLADGAFAGDLDDVVARAKDAGIDRALCVLSAIDAGESQAARRVRSLWPEVRFTVGVHPHQAAQVQGGAGAVTSLLERAVAAEQAAAVGEIGLDYHYDFAPRDVQQAVFEAQAVWARQAGLPVVIHTREATEDTFAILRTAGEGKLRGVFHCFTGDTVMARAALDLGFYISLAGIVTFPKAAELREVARLVPQDRLLVETDSPYLAPVPYRGKRNEPAFVARVVAVVAEARGLPAVEIEGLTSRNFDAFLGSKSFPANGLAR